MSSDQSRRRVLLATGGLASAALAGCAGSLGGSPTDPDPDAGTDQYGVRLENRTGNSYEVALDVKKGFTPSPIWSETVTVEGKTTRNWDGVITEATDHQLLGRLTHEYPGRVQDAFGADGIDRLASDRLWITPGGDDSPDVADLQVILRREVKDPGWGEDPMEVTTLNITYEGEDTPTETV